MPNSSHFQNSQILKYCNNIVIRRNNENTFHSNIQKKNMKRKYREVYLKKIQNYTFFQKKKKFQRPSKTLQVRNISLVKTKHLSYFILYESTNTTKYSKNENVEAKAGYGTASICLNEKLFIRLMVALCSERQRKIRNNMKAVKYLAFEHIVRIMLYRKPHKN